MPRFVQELAPLPDLYADDHVLKSHLDRLLGEVGHKAAAPLLEALAADASGPLRAAARDCEAHPPVLHQFDGWGRRVDRIEPAPGWETLRRAAAEHGLVALPYEAEARSTWGAGARIVHLAMLDVFVPWSATYGCPVAMSDGAVAVLQADGVDPALRDRLVSRLLSRDPADAWTSGQWMTESEGGSDVGRATTRAWQDEAGDWRLTGEKWFCSSTNSEMAIALARPDSGPSGSRGLACFVVPRYAGVAGAEGDPAWVAPGLRIHRLKDKLGTRGMPSAEVGFEGATGWPVGDPAEPGLYRMLQLVQVTRLHNAASSAAGMRRGLLVARAYAASREAFGAKLDRQPLHREVLSGLAVDAEASFALTALCFSLLGAVENGDDASAPLLRFAATLAKARTAKLAVAAASEVVEAFGGPGYIEDTEVPRILRDAQVLPIWEGTTNVLSLDVLRALSRDGALAPYLERVDAALDLAAAALPRRADDLRTARDAVATTAAAAAAAPADPGVQAGARVLMTAMADLLAAVTLVEHAADRGDDRGALVADVWIGRRLAGEPMTGIGHDRFDTLVDGR